MDDHAHTTLRVGLSAGVATVTIANPPVDVLDVALTSELRRVLVPLQDDDGVRVIVFSSADPDFFVAHVDMTLDPAAAALAVDVPEGLNAFQVAGELLRHQPQVTVVELAGVARGGGAELVTAADVVFAAIGRAGIGQVEALRASVPGGGGTQYLARPPGPSRPPSAPSRPTTRGSSSCASTRRGRASSPDPERGG